MYKSKNQLVNEAKEKQAKQADQTNTAAKNSFTRAEFVAYRLQIWRDTFNVAFQGTGARPEMVEKATKAADDAIEAFAKQFKQDIVS